MKLRIRGNTLRLRLTRPEIDELSRTGRVEDRIHFGPFAILTYRIEANEDVSATVASFDQAVITIRISSTEMRTWTSSDLVGIYSQQSIGNKQNLKITLEKDFACFENRSSEDDSENYPNPKGGHIQ